MTLDFEFPLWKAVRSCFPSVKLQGCVFHWTQAVYRKVSRIRRVQHYWPRLHILMDCTLNNVGAETGAYRRVHVGRRYPQLCEETDGFTIPASGGDSTNVPAPPSPGSWPPFPPNRLHRRVVVGGGGRPIQHRRLVRLQASSTYQQWRRRMAPCTEQKSQPPSPSAVLHSRVPPVPWSCPHRTTDPAGQRKQADPYPEEKVPRDAG